MSEYAFEGPKWASTTVTWSFVGDDPYDGFSHSITDPRQQAVVRQALADWSSLTGIQFAQVADGSSGGGPDFRIGYANLGYAGSGSYDVLGITYYYASGATFSPGTLVALEDPAYDTLTPGVGGAPTYRENATLYQVVAHEVGHVLGLDHSTDRHTLMYPYASTDNRTISSYDVQGVRTLYGLDGSGPPPGPMTIDFAHLGVTVAAGSAGTNVVFMNNGDDYYTTGGQDTVVADAGNDTVNALAGRVLAFGGTGTFTFLEGAATSEVVGGSGVLLVQGGTGPLTAFGGIGPSRITGGTGTGNILVGGARDSLAQGRGSGDLIVAGSGNATLTATGSNSTVFGGGAVTVINLSDNQAVVVGGNGPDTVNAGARATIFPGLGAMVIDISVGTHADTAGATNVIVGFDSTRDHIYLSQNGGAATEFVPTFTTAGYSIQTLSDGVLLAVFA